MKRAGALLAGILALTALSLPAAAGDKAPGDNNCACGRNTITSLMIGIQSDNEGLRESAAFVLGELKCTEAVIPLMRMLHEEESESVRITAALALSLIGEARGVYAVKRAAEFDESPRVRVLSAFFYNEYVHPATFAFIYEAVPDSGHYASN